MDVPVLDDCDSQWGVVSPAQESSLYEELVVLILEAKLEHLVNAKFFEVHQMGCSPYDCTDWQTHVVRMDLQRLDAAEAIVHATSCGLRLVGDFHVGDVKTDETELWWRLEEAGSNLPIGAVRFKDETGAMQTVMFHPCRNTTV